MSCKDFVIFHKSYRYLHQINAFGIYRIMVILNVETDIITSIAASPTAAILLIMCVEIFKTDVIVFIGDVIMCLTSH
jgi:nucleoside phosphorylase